MTIETSGPGLGPSAGPAESNPARELLRLGLRAMVHERLPEARGFLEAAAGPLLSAGGATSISASDGAVDAETVDALAYLGSVRWALGDIEGAREATDRALALGPARFAPNQKAGEVALRLGDPERAAELFLAALRASEPGTGAARAAEASLRSARKRAAGGIKHGAVLPGRPSMAGLRARLRAARAAGRRATLPPTA